MKEMINKEEKHYELANFQEPVLWIIRRTGKIDFMEKATKGLMEIKHSDGEKRYIRLDPKKQLIMAYGTKHVRTYIIHEDNPFPLPQSPLMDSEQFTNNTDLTINNAGNFRAKELKAQSEIIKWVFLGIAIVIGVYFLGKLMLPAEVVKVVTQPAVETAKTAVSNATKSINMIG